MDQAVTLRRMAKTYESPASGRDKSLAMKVVAVTSGKGGVGKTNIVTNLGITLSKMGKRVMIFDADLGLGNVDVLLGLTPKYNIDHLLAGKKSLAEVVVKGPSNMLILPSSSGSGNSNRLSLEHQVALMNGFKQLAGSIDFFLIDTGAGIDADVRYFSSISEEVVVVVSPEPTSITDAYALMKVLSRHHNIKKFKLLVNMVKGQVEAQLIYERICKVAEKFLCISIDFVGLIPFDKNLPLSVCNQKAVVDLFPDTYASKGFLNVAENVVSWLKPEVPKRDARLLWQ